MGSVRGRLTAGWLAQIGGQILTACALGAHMLAWPEVSIWVVVPLLAALAVPFRHDGTFRDRAVACFGASSVMAGMLGWEVVLGDPGDLFGGTVPAPGAFTLFALAASVLLGGAGAAFWLSREARSR